MFKPDDILQIEALGIHPAVISQQIENFRKGFVPLRLIEAATVYHGIVRLSDEEVNYYISVFEEKKSKGLTIIKFVPASGAASRMFKALYSTLDDLKNGKSLSEVKMDKEAASFLDNLEKFAFYEEFKPGIKQITNETEAEKILKFVLTDVGLNYGNLPKALIKFHRYENECRTSLEEHFVEGAMYATDSNSVVKLHFTVSAEHQQRVEELVGKVKPGYEKEFGVSYEVSFSNQKPATDTIAASIDNEPFRDKNGNLLFRPAGHGALLENLNDLDSDVIFIKNIDNVAPDHLKSATIRYKKALAGVLLTLQKQIFDYQKLLSSHKPEEIQSGTYAELAGFLEGVLNIAPPPHLLSSEKEDLYNYIWEKINRPIRVCGMVKNTGEPGGGPFFALNRDGSVSLQIAESSQIDFQVQEQATIARHATHFNPVDLVCGVKNSEGKKFNLQDFVDPETGLITQKSYDGKELKAQELPGLWNGSMSDWNTLFVEVPTETFSPVKTVNDLLRKEHQPK